MKRRNPFTRRTPLERSGLGKSRPPAKRSKRSTRRTPSRGPVLRTVLLGKPLAIEYRHAAGGKFRHTFSAGARLSYTPDGRHLVIDGIDVRAFIND